MIKRIKALLFPKPVPLAPDYQKIARDAVTDITKRMSSMTHGPESSIGASAIWTADYDGTQYCYYENGMMTAHNYPKPGQKVDFAGAMCEWRFREGLIEMCFQGRWVAQKQEIQDQYQAHYDKRWHVEKYGGNEMLPDPIATKIDEELDYRWLKKIDHIMMRDEDEPLGLTPSDKTKATPH